PLLRKHGLELRDAHKPHRVCPCIASRQQPVPSDRQGVEERRSKDVKEAGVLEIDDRTSLPDDLELEPSPVQPPAQLVRRADLSPRGTVERLDVRDLHTGLVDPAPEQVAHHAARTRRAASTTRSTDGM